MRCNWKAAGVSVAIAGVLAGCSSVAGNAISYEHFRFTCCSNPDLQQAWHPGQDLTLHWIGESAGVTADATGRPMTLTAILIGPYPSVALLKAGGQQATVIAAPAIPVTDRTSSNPVSSIALPSTLPTGWYNLVFTDRSAGGNGIRSATVIQVTPAAT
jgi:hypothetical protein